LERTYVMIKPDGVKRKIVGEIISRIERAGYDIARIKSIIPSIALAKEHYKALEGKDYFLPNCEFIASGTVVAMIVYGHNAIDGIRKMIGSTQVEDRLPGTIRFDFSTELSRNVIHGSDSKESAEREIELWYPELSS